MKDYKLISKKILNLDMYKEDYINYYGFEKANNLYCIYEPNEDSYDQQIMDNYHFSLKEYSQIIFKNNGIKDMIYNVTDDDLHNFAFLNMQDCENAIDDLQLLIVMKKLIYSDERDD